ncbi:hypothetical protein RFI_22777 [Reticulomyxa filosa]|uniref:Uncharacterized protein n=1 Tax=Reticulomyxa filosa TaxID=46433 RepID=X6MMC8_RETFI|nr:hypothetical protein RFI_22777 [Reticulomyxa filosa]|eukprot:ETO14592.1 hypothetical protein RFI_22777 [Reticulomyxa filosa]
MFYFERKLSIFRLTNSFEGRLRCRGSKKKRKIKEKMENRRRAVSVLATSAKSMHSRTPDGSEKVEEKHNKMLECGDFPQNQKQHFQVPPQLEWKEEMETAIDNRKYWDTLDQMLKTLWLGIGIIRLNFGEKKCFIGTGCVFYVRKEEVYALTWSGNLECIDTNTKEKKTLKKAWFERRETSKAWIGVTSESKAIYSICEYWEHGHFAVMKFVETSANAFYSIHWPEMYGFECKKPKTSRLGNLGILFDEEGAELEGKTRMLYTWMEQNHQHFHVYGFPVDKKGQLWGASAPCKDIS